MGKSLKSRLITFDETVLSVLGKPRDRLFSDSQTLSGATQQNPAADSLALADLTYIFVLPIRPVDDRFALT